MKQKATYTQSSPRMKMSEMEDSGNKVDVRPLFEGDTQGVSHPKSTIEVLSTTSNRVGHGLLNKNQKPKG